MKLTFAGATGTVTGSKYLLEIEGQKVLVDCGLFQGQKELRLRNWAKLPFDPHSLNAVVLTHAHIDHSGYIPLLVKQGFKGKVYATKATHELCQVLLPDSGYLQEEDAKHANKHGYSKHHPAQPLYTQHDAEIALKQFQEVDYKTPYPLLKSAQFSWHRAGHILGSAFVQIEHQGIKTLFSGDIGRLRDPIMRPSAIIKNADYLILESTYGNRLHDKKNPAEDIANIINLTAQRGGTVLIPAFAVGRAQTLLYYIQQLKQKKLIPDLPVFLDSPMAIDATEILLHNQQEHHLTPAECLSVCHTATYINSPDESIALNYNKTPKIIISASGMMTGGRVLHHLKFIAPDPKNTIIIAGFQAQGTRGDRLLHHEGEIKIHGEMIPVRSQLAVISNASAHGDYEEILAWLSHFESPPKKVFLTHGEPDASQALKQHIHEKLGWDCIIPNYLDEWTLN